MTDTAAGHVVDMSDDMPGDPLPGMPDLEPPRRPARGRSSGAKLTAPRIRVTPMPGSDLADTLGTAFVVKASNPDLVAFDLTAAKHRWPAMTAAPFLWLTFLAWHACRRQGLTLPSLTFEAFRDQTDDLSAADDDDPEGTPGGADVVDPTPPARGPGSAAG